MAGVLVMENREIRDPILRQLLVNWRGVLPKPKNNEWWTMSDIDGFGERNGKFLFIEWKGSGVKVDPNGGQFLALARLSEKPDMHVMVFWGDIPEGPVEAYMRIGLDKSPIVCIWKTGERNPAIQAFIDWYKWADSGNHLEDPWTS